MIIVLDDGQSGDNNNFIGPLPDRVFLLLESGIVVCLAAVALVRMIVDFFELMESLSLSTTWHVVVVDAQAVLRSSLKHTQFTAARTMLP